MPVWFLESAKLKEIVLERLAKMPDSLRDTPQSPDNWSASGVVEHLILVEEKIAGPWRAALMADGPAPGFRATVVSTMVSFAMGGTTARVPSIAELFPVGGLSIEELASRWAKAREDLATELPRDSKAAWIQHPVFGPLSSDQMGKLLVAHLKHHLRHWPKVS